MTAEVAAALGVVLVGGPLAGAGFLAWAALVALYFVGSAIAGSVVREWRDERWSS